MYLLKLILSYDGTSYFGWQKTRMGPSIQETVEQAVYRITGELAPLEGASRTDRGVHAEGQSASLALKREWDPEDLKRALNAVLPPEIRTRSVKTAHSTFHPTLDAVEKEYHYRLCLGSVQEPMFRLYSWAIRYPLDLEKMAQGAKECLGTRDFSAFANEKKENPVCTVKKIEISPLPEERLQIALTGDRFLYKMARNLVGTLVYVGCGKLQADQLPALLASKDRKQAGVTAPAHGLFLHRVVYPC